MNLFTKLILCIVIICCASLIVEAQSADTSIIDKFIAGHAAREHGEEPDGIRKILMGDLNHDGLADAAVLYTIEGQNGTNNYVQYLAVFLSRSGQLVYAANTPVGGKNRRSIELTSIKDNAMYFDTTAYAKRDPSCCPTIKGTTKYALAGRKLIESRPR